jgi:hypothetical protein
MEYYNLDQSKTFLVSQKALLTQDERLLILKMPTGFLQSAEPVWELPGGLLEMDEDCE